MKRTIVKKTHELSKRSENVFFDYPHAKERMLERGVSIQQVLDVLRQGKGVDGPNLDTYGCWRIKLERFFCRTLYTGCCYCQRKPT